LPLEELTNYLVEKYKSHPSNLQEILVQHRGVENGKSLTSLLLIFDKYFWLTSDSEFTIAVAEKKITGLAKPGWNLEKSREMFAVCHDDNKYNWPANKKMEN
jgi:hypothetical protein